MRLFRPSRFVFDEPAVNTSIWPQSNALGQPGIGWSRSGELRTTTLAELLREHLPVGRIDFLSVDVEGFDAEVLGSNDWDAFAPEVVPAETFGQAVEETRGSSVARILSGQGYELLSKTANTAILTR